MSRFTRLGALACLSPALGGCASEAPVAPHAAPAAVAATAKSGMPATRPGWTAAHVNVMDTACRPNYPPEALKDKTQGVTQLSFSVDETGRLIEAHVAGRSGDTPAHQALDQEALRALSKCSFKPAFDDKGKPQPGTMMVSYHWVLD